MLRTGPFDKLPFDELRVCDGAWRRMLRANDRVVRSAAAQLDHKPQSLTPFGRPREGSVTKLRKIFFPSKQDAGELNKLTKHCLTPAMGK